MRARRLLARRKLPTSGLASPPGVVGKVAGTTKRTLALPTLTSPRHPKSFRMEHGLYKYTTGMRDPSRSMRRSFDITDASFKVYSTGALSSSECLSAQRLLHADDRQSPHTNLIERLYHIAAKVHTINDSIVSVFFQVARDKTGLRSLTLPWTRISAWARQWNLYCETYRSPENSTTSVPRICLTISGLDDWIRVPHGPWSKGPIYIGVALSADLRTSILRSDVGDKNAYDHASDRISSISIQPIVDDILCAMSRVIQRSSINDPGDLMVKLQMAISVNIKTSVLPSILDFRDMEIVIKDRNRQRYVSNTFLNPDGSERSQAINEEDARRTPVAVTGSHRISNYVVSEFTKRKLGIGVVGMLVDAPQGSPVKLLPITATELAQEFDIISRHSDETGLACCVKAINTIAQRHRTIHGRLILRIKNSSTGPCHNVFFNFPDGRHAIERFIDIQQVASPFKVRLSEFKETSIRIGGVQLGFDLSQGSDKPLQDPSCTSGTATDEVAVLLPAFESVCEQVLEMMEFRSLDEVPYKLARAVLEILRMPSSRTILTTVALNVHSVDDPESLFRAQASLETEPFSTGEPADTGDVPFKNALATGEENTTQARPTHEASYQTPLVLPTYYARANPSIPRRHTARDLASRGSRSSLFHKEIDGELLTGLATKMTPSKVLEEKSGFESIRVSAAWPSSVVVPSAEVNTERLAQAVADNLQTCCESAGLLVPAFRSKMLEFEPHPRYLVIRLRTRHTPPIEIRARSDSGRSDEIWIKIYNGDTSSDNDLAVQFPGFRAALKVDGQHWNPDTKGEFLFAFKGQFSHEVHYQDLNEAAQMRQIFQILHSISADFLNHRSFISLNILASDLLDTLLDRRQEFGAIIDLQLVRLIVRIPGLSRGGPALDRVEHSRAVGSQITESGAAHFESQETDSWVLDQEEDTEIVEQREVEVQSAETTLSILEPGEDDGTIEVQSEERDLEVQPAEATLSILEPRNDEETIEEPSQVGSESSAAILKVVEAHEQVQATPDQEENENQSNDLDKLAFVALGSNLGDRLENIENACREMDADPDIHLLGTSLLYETKPMYVTDQGSFLNGVCEIRTTLNPFQLLDRLKAIEDRLGRVKIIDKGPRCIDLDILLFGRSGRVAITTEHLTIPHLLMHEREFVLRPLKDMRRAQSVRVRGKRINETLARLPQAPSPMHSVHPLGPRFQYLHPSDLKRTTRIMSVLNVTPDSFSDGGDNELSNRGMLQETIRAQIEAGATIVDVGGQSSRPNAPDVTAEEEISRVLPAIEAIKSLPEAADIAISVDTYRASVAQAAVKAGAHIVNDISAGKLDPEMFATVARLGCTYVMMHMRGTPSTMMDPENCTYQQDLVGDVARELRHQIHKAQDAGIRRWRIIADPGIGFSKTSEQNLQLLTQLPRVKDGLPALCPLLVGTSRKSFIGKITGVQEPKERVWGTAATVTAAVQGGADIVRVHDVREMADVVKMADAMYRT